MFITGKMLSSLIKFSKFNPLRKCFGAQSGKIFMYILRIKGFSQVATVNRLKGSGSGPVHTETIVNANASKRKLFCVFRPSVHTKTMKTLTVNA